MKLFMFFSFFVDGFAYAGEALVGKAYGEKSESQITNDQSPIKNIVRALFNWSLGVGLFFTLFYALTGRANIELMTNDADVITASSRYIGWLIAMPLISTLAFMWDGIYVGATAGKQIRNSMIWAAVSFVIGYAATYRFVGAQALYIAYFAHLIARSVYLTLEWKGIVNSEK